MNLDLLKKLTRLANNNPNDNEANLAARRVCKMLAECNFKLVNDVRPIEPPLRGKSPIQPDPIKPDPVKERKPWNYEPSKAQEDYFRKFWENEMRGIKIDFGQGRDYSKEYRRYDIPKVIIVDYDPIQMDYILPDGTRISATEFHSKPHNYSVREKSKKEKRPLECTKCHQTKETAYVGNLFKCNDCIWKEYNDMRNL